MKEKCQYLFIGSFYNLIQVNFFFLRKWTFAEFLFDQIDTNRLLNTLKTVKWNE